jgi:iron complex transport system substrate-binding protein
VGFFIAFILLLLLGCADRAGSPAAAAPPAIALVDDTGQHIRLRAPARRVISLVPAATETIIALGASDRLVARTRYDRDSSVTHLPVVGGGLDPSLEAIITLSPDLVILWASDKRTDLRGRLQVAGIATMALSLEDTTDAYRAIEVLGQALGRETARDTLLQQLRMSLKETQALARTRPRRRVFYVVYNDPPMTAGAGTFITQLLGVAGGENIFGQVETKWPTVALEEVVRRDPDIIVLPVGEMPARTIDRLRQEPGWRDLRAVRSGCVAQINADIANRPGPNVARAARELYRLIHNEICPAR